MGKSSQNLKGKKFYLSEQKIKYPPQQFLLQEV